VATLNQIFPTTLGAVNYYTFFDPSNTGNTFTVNLNPITVKRKPANLRKYVATTNSTAILTGAFEGPVSEVSISWNQLDYSQLQLLVPFTQISPIVMIDQNNTGYLGVLCIDSCEQLAGFTRNIWAVQASFLVISPYSGTGTPLNTLVAPTITATLSGSAGFIPTAQDLYLWSTVFTSRSATSESVVGTVTHIHTSSANVAYNLTWTPPSSLYFSKLRIYWAVANTPTTATLLTEVLSGFPQDLPSSFTLWNNYVAYNTENPPTYGTAFPGYWGGSLWIQGT